ncbi:glycosyltransferase family 2 protein [Thermodesulfobacteriota bacterium]
MTPQNRVTALVPAYEAAAFISKTLDSLSSQTLNKFDVIISVDTCKDDTHTICQKYCVNYENFRVIRQDRRLGWVGNCNYLLEQAETRYALFALHDDVLAPTYLEKLCQALDERPDVVICYSDMLVTFANGEHELQRYPELDGMQNTVLRGQKMLNKIGYWWVPYRGIFRLNQARKINGLKLHGAGDFSADWPWLFHMSLLGEFLRIPETLCYKFQKKDSHSGGWKHSPKHWHEATLACMQELWSSELTLWEKLYLTLRFHGGPHLAAKLAVRHIQPQIECHD